MSFCNISADQILSDEVRKYPCLYDKCDRDYKVRDRVNKSWRAVEEALNLAPGRPVILAISFLLIII